MSEEWRSVPGWEGIYEVSDQGGVRSLDRVVTGVDGAKYRFRGQVLKPSRAHSGHLQVALSNPEKGRGVYYVHRLVLEAFIGPCPLGMESLHGNGDPADNRLKNLRWGTRLENQLDTVAHGAHKQTQKTHCPRGHALEDPNLVPSKKPRRSCLACARAKSMIYSRPDLKPDFQEMSDRYYSELIDNAKAQECKITAPPII